MSSVCTVAKEISTLALAVIFAGGCATTSRTWLRDSSNGDFGEFMGEGSAGGQLEVVTNTGKARGTFLSVDETTNTILILTDASVFDTADTLRIPSDSLTSVTVSKTTLSKTWFPIGVVVLGVAIAYLAAVGSALSAIPST